MSQIQTLLERIFEKGERINAKTAGVFKIANKRKATLINYIESYLNYGFKLVLILFERFCMPTSINLSNYFKDNNRQYNNHC